MTSTAMHARTKKATTSQRAVIAKTDITLMMITNVFVSSIFVAKGKQAAVKEERVRILREQKS